MELTVSNPNLHSQHPIWAKALGITPQASPSNPAAIHRSPLTAAIAAMTGQSSAPQGWQVTNHPHRPGAPVGVKKRLGPGLWVRTVATPGDARYPVHS